MSDQQIQKVKVKRLAHVGLWATDGAAQARFYRQVMGFDLRKAVDTPSAQDIEVERANIFLSLGDEHHSLGLFNDTATGPSNVRTPIHLLRFTMYPFEVSTM